MRESSGQITLKLDKLSVCVFVCSLFVCFVYQLQEKEEKGAAEEILYRYRNITGITGIC